MAWNHPGQQNENKENVAKRSPVRWGLSVVLIVVGAAVALPVFGVVVSAVSCGNAPDCKGIRGNAEERPGR